MVDRLQSFSPAERERIRRAVEDARASTAAKFEFYVVPSSDRYALYPMVWAAVVALTATGALALLRPDLGIGIGFAVNALTFVALSLVFDWWPIRVRLVPHAVKRLAASRMAHREFATNLMSRDQEHNGVMLFVSLAERHLELIAEREAHSHVPPGTWDRIVSDALSTMRRQGVTDGLVGAISACGSALGSAFPSTRA